MLVDLEDDIETVVDNEGTNSDEGTKDEHHAGVEVEQTATPPPRVTWRHSSFAPGWYLPRCELSVPRTCMATFLPHCKYPPA